jgi:hypothetical protein
MTYLRTSPINKRLSYLGNSQLRQLVNVLEFKEAFKQTNKAKKEVSVKVSKPQKAITKKHIAEQLDMCFEPNTQYTSAPVTAVKTFGTAKPIDLTAVPAAPVMTNREIRDEIINIFKNYLTNTYAPGSDNNTAVRAKLLNNHGYDLYKKCYEALDLEMMNEFKVDKQGLKKLGYRNMPGKKYIDVLEEKGQLWWLLKVATQKYASSNLQ